MTLRHMRIFLSICDNGCNTTRAAEELHIAQPAVSLAIKELEQYYGVMLFDRMGRRLKITEAGERLKEYARHICAMFDDMEKGMRNWDSFGVLRVGSSITIGSQFLPGYVKAFYKKYPGTQVRVSVAPSELLESKLMNNELDFALFEGLPGNSSLVAEPYMQDHLSVICPADGRFPQGACIPVEEFCRQDFLLREPGSGTREVFERVMRNAGVSVCPIWEAVSTTALINAVISGLGISVLPHRLVQEALQRGDVQEITVEGLDFKRRFYMIYHKEKYLTASAKAFLQLCRNYEIK